MEMPNTTCPDLCIFRPPNCTSRLFAFTMPARKLCDLFLAVWSHTIVWVQKNSAALN